MASAAGCSLCGSSEAGGALLRRTGPPRAAAALRRLGALLASLWRREASASQAGPSMYAAGGAEDKRMIFSMHQDVLRVLSADVGPC